VSANPGLDSIIRQNLQDLLSSPEQLPGEFWNYATQHAAQNPVPLQATISPTIIASGVGSSSNTPTRYVGGTTSGAPATGTYVAGDFVVSHDGHVYVCTATGTPGTWSTWPAQGEIAYNDSTGLPPYLVGSTNFSTPTVIIGGTTVSYAASTPIYIEAFSLEVTTPSVSGDTILCLIDGTTFVVDLGRVGTSGQQISAPFYVQYKITPTAGTHKYGLGAYATSLTGSPAIGAPPAFIRTRYA
jgi:hypothetical protein